ncbi:MAG: UDP-N-acetylmuramate dehydrogenase [Colwellia sp.]|nr:UDP-N-acetylmuramate dehydrogenase [Colwellia sp.]
MESSQQFSLQEYNSFNIIASCPTIYFPKSLADLKSLPDLSNTPFYILGDGSNTLFVEECSPIIIKPNFCGVKISVLSDQYIVNVGAGENWHELVQACLTKGIFGLENLALIPGSVGAAPVQNIGAYGVEFSDFCKQIKWFEFSTQSLKTLSKEECDFSYRNSIFKQRLHNKGIITEVVFSFPKKWIANLSYAGLIQLGENPTAIQVMNKVISLRQEKLPDPKLLPNAGSFFKNPIVSANQASSLKEAYPKIPLYKQDNGQVKVAAGWLIEQTGLKGFRTKGVGVHDFQALVLVNYESTSGKDIIKLAKYVQQQVLAKFDILISPEVRIITMQGEQQFSDLMATPEYI